MSFQNQPHCTGALSVSCTLRIMWRRRWPSASFVWFQGLSLVAGCTVMAQDRWQLISQPASLQTVQWGSGGFTDEHWEGTLEQLLSSCYASRWWEHVTFGLALPSCLVKLSQISLRLYVPGGTDRSTSVHWAVLLVIFYHGGQGRVSAFETSEQMICTASNSCLTVGHHPGLVKELHS